VPAPQPPLKAGILCIRTGFRALVLMFLLMILSLAQVAEKISSAPRQNRNILTKGDVKIVF
jgi:hypothetical protein